MLSLYSIQGNSFNIYTRASEKLMASKIKQKRPTEEVEYKNKEEMERRRRKNTREEEAE